MELDSLSSGYNDPPGAWNGAMLRSLFKCTTCDVTFRNDGHPGRCFVCGRFGRCTSCTITDCGCGDDRRRKATMKRAMLHFEQCTTPAPGIATAEELDETLQRLPAPPLSVPGLSTAEEINEFLQRHLGVDHE